MGASPEDSDESARERAGAPSESLVSRRLAAVVLVVTLAAAAASAWLLVTGDFESARPGAATDAGAPLPAR